MVITSPDSSKDKLSVQIKGYEHQELPEEEEGKVLPYEFEEIANDIFRLLRGSTNLVFCKLFYQLSFQYGVVETVTDNLFEYP